MLTPETIEKMNAMKLFGLVSAFETQLSSSEYKELSFEERVGLLVSQARISPRRVLPRHARNELTDVLRRRRSAWTPVLAAIVLGCDEVAVPAQKRSGCGNGCNMGQRLAAQSLGLDREHAPVVVRETETLAPKPGLEHTVLLLLVVDHILLLAVDPAS